MSVVEDVDSYVDDDPEPTWEEAVAAFEGGTPVRVVRPPRKLTVVYRYADGIFTATSPDLAGFRVTGRSLHETRGLVREDLEDFLDPAVEVIEQFPTPEPSIATTANCSGFMLSSSYVVAVTSSGAGRAFISPTRASTRRVPA